MVLLYFWLDYKKIKRIMNLQIICKKGDNMEKNYNTKPKEYILEFLKKHKGMSFSVQDIYDDIIEEGYSINLATVYRNIVKMTEAGMLLKHQASDSKYATYQYVESSKCLTHFHFECKNCGVVVALDNKETNEFVKMVKNILGFTVDPQNTYLTGTCKKCGERFICL